MAESYSVTAYLKAHDTNFSKQFEKAQSTVGKFQSKVGNSMAKVGEVVVKAGKVAAVALGAFGVYGIKSAANIRVVEAQYSQAFEGVSKEADNMVGDMSKSFNMLPERLKAPMSSFQSYFKGTGMEVDKSLKSTEKAMTLAADSSAYYDTSIEETSASLKGFLLGNFENGDAIGINTNLTKIGQKYNEKYGGSFDDLSESQKQNYLLEYVEDIYALNGVMGQSKREGDSFENVFSNLKSSVANFAAAVMDPFMDPLINAMQRAGEWMSTADEKFFAFVETIQNSTAFQSLQEVVQMAIDKVKEFGESEAWATIVTAFQDLGQAILDIDFVAVVESIGEFLTTWGPLIAGIWAGIEAFKLITAAMVIITPIITAVGVAGGILAVAIGFLTSPIFLAALAIGALITIGILLWQNWDTIKQKLTELKDKFIADWNELKEIVGGAMTTLKDSAIADFEELKTMGSTAVTTLKDAAIADFNELGAIGSAAIETLKTAAVGDFNELKTGGSNAFETLKTAAVADATELKTGAGNMIQTLKTAAVNDFNQLKTGGSNAFKTLKNAGVNDFNQLKSIASNAVSTLKSTAISQFNELKNGAIRAWNTLKSTTSSVFNSLKGTISSALSNINLFSAGKAIIDGFLRGLKSAYEGVKSFVGGIASWIKDHKGPISYDRKLLIGAGNAIMEGLDKGLKHSFKDVQSTVGSMADQLQGTFNGGLSTSSFDMAASAKSLNGSVNQSVNHIVSDNLNNGKQPLNLNVQLGNRAYKLFVDDISNTQNAQAQLVETYL